MTGAAAFAATKDTDVAARLTYTSGNIAVERGELAQARAAYEAVLRADPTDRDAKANLELVLRRIAPPPPAPQQQPQQQPGQQGTPQPGQQGQQPGQQGQQPAPQGTPQPGQQPGQQSGQPGQGSGQPNGATGPATAAAAAAALDAALAQLGPEVTADEARRILELAGRANDLQQLTPRSGGRGVPPR